MNLRVSPWHIALAFGLLIPGCFDSHGRFDPRALPEPIDAGPLTRDAGPVRPGPRDAGPRRDAGRRPDDGGAIPDRCAELFELIRSGAPPGAIGCDGRTFPRDCTTPVGECCVLSLACMSHPGDGGEVIGTLSCDDSCDQRCAGQAREDCALFPYCEFFDPGACGEPPPGTIGGPACIGRRGPRCGDATVPCPSGMRCQSFWVDPCAGLGCDACGGEESFCAP